MTNKLKVTTPVTVLAFRYLRAACVVSGFLPLMRPATFVQRLINGLTRPAALDLTLNPKTRHLIRPDNSLAASRVADMGVSTCFLLIPVSAVLSFIVVSAGSLSSAEKLRVWLFFGMVSMNLIVAFVIR